MNIFIVGSPRSGTTLLSDTLGLHPEITSWNEPNFVLDHFHRDLVDDCRNAHHASSEVITYLRKKFDYLRQKQRSSIIVDKSPSSSLKIPFLKTVFPNAKFIHMLRDGRDATLSIKAAQEWSNAQQGLDLFTSIEGLRHAIYILRNTVGRQPLIQHMLAQIWFEAGSLRGLIDPRKQLHRTKWGGRRHCWGPRYVGWRNVVDRLSPIETNATLWAKCVDAVLDEKGPLSESSSYLEVRYESFIQHPAIELPRICSFLDLADNFDFSTGIDLVKSTNFNKWQSAMTREMKLVIGPILGPTLRRSGYEEDESWCSL